MNKYSFQQHEQIITLSSIKLMIDQYRNRQDKSIQFAHFCRFFPIFVNFFRCFLSKVWVQFYQVRFWFHFIHWWILGLQIYKSELNCNELCIWTLLKMPLEFSLCQTEAKHSLLFLSKAGLKLSDKNLRIKTFRVNLSCLKVKECLNRENSSWIIGVKCNMNVNTIKI